MITKQQLNTMKNVDIRTMDKAALHDVSGFFFDASLSKTERAARVIAATQNPYCFRYGDTAVQVEFTDNGPPLQDLISGFLARQKSAS